MDTVTPLPDNEVLPRQAAEIRPYPNENKLYRIMAVLSVLLLVLFTVGTVGTLWLFILWGFLGVLCLTSYFISHVRGNGVQITAEQFPELHQRLLKSCAVVGIDNPPEFYLLAGDGMRNAFAARFLNRYYVVLLSDIVDALEDDEEALNFYIGHELGHIARRHLTRGWLVLPAMWLPLIGSAYSRAREYTCDQYGLACCASTDSAVHALTVLSAGSRRWKTLNKSAFVGQAAATGGFWMSLNELLADYPWLTKRVARVRGEENIYPKRHPVATALACLVPRTGLGVVGAFIMYSYLALIALVVAFGLSAMSGFPALPGPSDDTDSAAIDTSAAEIGAVAGAHEAAMAAVGKIDAYVKANKRWPASLTQAGYEPAELDGVEAIELPADAERVVSVRFKEPYAAYRLDYVRMADLGAADGEWTCGASGVPDHALPSDCQSNDAATAEPPAETPAETPAEAP